MTRGMPLKKRAKTKKFKTATLLTENLRNIARGAKNKTDSLINLHQNDELGVYLRVALLGQSPSLTSLKTCYASLSEEAKNTPSAQLLLSKINLINDITIGQKAPDFKFIDKHDKPHTLYEISGKVIIIDFWASWCGPCRKENPTLKVLYEKYKHRGLEIVSISLDKDKNQWQNAVHKDHLTWLQLIVPDAWNNHFLKQYNIESIPATFIIDADKKIIGKGLRDKALENFIATYLKNNR